MTPPARIPLPPPRLVWRVGCPRDERQLMDEYDRRGRAVKEALLGLLPAGWAWEGKRVLDFGCGAGRVLRQFMGEAKAGAEIWGCDIHSPSVRWVEANLCPPLRVSKTGAAPPLPWADGTFDLAWAVAVFSHLTDSWAAWLLELHRVLAPGGLLIATFIGEGASVDTRLGEPWDENRVGMNVLCCGRKWDAGGPLALHSPWWVREHWGRAFDVVELRPSGFAGSQGVAVLRRRGVALTVEDLERWAPDEPRELEALRYNRLQLQRELEGLRATRSWRLTAPLRRFNSRRLRARTDDWRPR